jgi:hypothetical protein
MTSLVGRQQLTNEPKKHFSSSLNNLNVNRLKARQTQKQDN